MSCGKSSGVDSVTQVSPTYSSISGVILQPDCVSCHSGAIGYGFDTYANTMREVKPGDPSSSPLYSSVSSGQMPPNGNTLSQEQIQAISDWITAQAPNN